MLKSRYEDLLSKNLTITSDIKLAVLEAMKVTKLKQSYDSNFKQCVRNTSCDVTAPFLYFYTYWVLETAIKNNLHTLYFLSRDGYVLLEIAKIIKKHFSIFNQLELKYLYGSRKAWHFASLSQIDEDVLNWVLQSPNCSVVEIFNNMDLKLDEVDVLLKHFNDVNVILSYEEKHKLICLLKDNEKIKELILQRALIRRNLVVRYLQQEGINNDAHIGVVDSGWSGKLQVSLSKILFLGGIYPKVGVSSFLISSMPIVSPFKNDTFYNYFDDKYAIQDYWFLIEAFMIAEDKGTCIGYTQIKDAVYPQFKTNYNVELHLWNGFSIQYQTILDYAVELSSTLTRLKISTKEVTYLTYVLLHSFFSNPDIYEATTYGAIVYDDNFANGQRYTLCKLLPKRSIIKILLSEDITVSGCYWREGVFTLYARGEMKFKILKILDHLVQYLRMLWRKVA